MDITAFLRFPLVIVVILVALAGCGAPKPAAPTPEELKRQADLAELEKLRAAEKERIAQEEAQKKAEEERRQEEERKKQETALPGEFGKPAPPAAEQRPAAAPPVIAGTPAVGTEQPAVPYDQAFPPIPDRTVRIAVVSAPSQANVAERIGVMLSETERANLERSLGMGLRIAYLSQADRDPKQATRIQYREKFLQAAVRLAGVIPEAQRVERMSEDDANRTGVDVVIQVGADLH